MTRLDRFIAFDDVTGRVRCEAGVLLKTIQRIALSRGWMLPVTPGTQAVTVGGAIANDVHGKNHHVYGSFGHHVHAMRLLRTDGTCIECGPNVNAEWFRATVGGLGLTGVVLEVELQLRPIKGDCLNTETLVFQDLAGFFELADASDVLWEYTVAWVDCVSKPSTRGVFMRANHTNRWHDVDSPREFTLPFTPPISLVNPFSLRVLNQAYYHLHARRDGQRHMHYEPFFYPLDSLLQWNRLYGPRGFYQYQCVVPRQDGLLAIQTLLDEIKRFRTGSFLAVLKTFGSLESLGLMSFPQAGVTLALDFPNLGSKTKACLARLDAIVSAFGGRLYCAKNAVMTPELLRAGYPKLDEFLMFRDPGISSGLSRRLLGS
jgi:FAD/FMN-containing dehydrogenase